jgi:cyclopropane fatty-acyl-phospholipid synthase-like methyltransferase
LFLAGAGYKVTAIDSSRVGLAKLERLAREQQLHSQITVRCADVSQVDYGPGEFDLIVADTILDHLPHAEILPLLERWVASLKSGGTIIARVHTVDDPGNPAKNTTRAASELAGMIRHYFLPDELRDYLDSLFQVTNYREYREEDRHHGRPHEHAYAIATAVKSPAG